MEENFLANEFQLKSRAEMKADAENALITSPYIFKDNGEFDENGLFSPYIWPQKARCRCGHSSVGDCPECGTPVHDPKDNNQRNGYIKLSTPVAGVFRSEIENFWSLTGAEHKLKDYLEGRYVQLTCSRVAKDGSIVQSTVEIARNAIASYTRNATIDGIVSHGDLVRRYLEKIRFDGPENCINTLNAEIDKLNGEVAFLRQQGDSAETLKSVAEKNETIRSKVRALAVLSALHSLEDRFGNPLTPCDLLSDYIVVPPPAKRPISKNDGGYSVGDTNELYLDVLKSVDPDTIERFQYIGSVKSPDGTDTPRYSTDMYLAELALKTKQVAYCQNVVNKWIDSVNSKNGDVRNAILKAPSDASMTAVGMPSYLEDINTVEIPYLAAYKLFEPFVIRQMRAENAELSIEGCKSLIEADDQSARSALEKIVADRVVLLERTPVMYRHGVMPLKPVLCDGNVLKINSLLCETIAGDFDGDSYTIYAVPDEKTERELSDYIKTYPNVFNSTTGELLIAPTENAALGLYCMTRNPSQLSFAKDKVVTARGTDTITVADLFASGTGKVKIEINGKAVDVTDKVYFRKGDKVLVTDESGKAVFQSDRIVSTLAYKADEKGWQIVDLVKRNLEIPKGYDTSYNTGDVIKVGSPYCVSKEGNRVYRSIAEVKDSIDRGYRINEPITYMIDDKPVKTTLGRVYYNDILYGGKYTSDSFVNYEVNAKKDTELMGDMLRSMQSIDIAEGVHRIEKLNQLGFELAKSSGVTLNPFDYITDEFKVPDDWDRMPEEEKQKFLNNISDKFKEEIQKNPDSSLCILLNSGARGSWKDASKIGSAIGTIVKQSGEKIPSPMWESYLSGRRLHNLLSAAEDAKKAVDKGYGVDIVGGISRLLKDAVYSFSIREDDCGSTASEIVRLKDKNDVLSRYTSDNVVSSSGEVILRKGELVSEAVYKQLEKAGVKEVPLRTALHCNCHDGVCAKCYGNQRGWERKYDVGHSIGLEGISNVAAQIQQNLMNTNKGITIVDSIGMIENMLKEQDVNKNPDYYKSMFVTNAEDYSKFLNAQSRSFRSKFGTLGLKMPSRDCDILVRTLYGRVRITDRGDSLFEAHSVQDGAYVMSEAKRLADEGLKAPSFTCSPSVLQEVAVDKTAVHEGRYDGALALASGGKNLMARIITDLSIGKTNLDTWTFKHLGEEKGKETANERSNSGLGGRS